MKLKNKKTGEILETARSSAVVRDKFRIFDENTNRYYTYDSLTGLNAEWEDAPEEPKPWWYIDITLVVKQGELFLSKHVEQFKTVGNYFETREEAEKAVEKLKAWKRLRDKGVKIIGYYCDGGTNTKGEFSGEVNVTIDVPQEVDITLFYLLFGGEE